MKDICVIVPTIREYGVMRRYFANARQHGFNLGRVHVLLVTEDFCDTKAMEAMLVEERVSGEVFTQKGRDAWFAQHGLEAYADLIPRRSHAETSFGLLWMQAHPQYRYGFFIDDDTLPEDAHDYFGTHMRNLEQPQELDVVSSDKRWVNVLHQTFPRHGLYPRGYPYSAMGETVSRTRGRTGTVVCSQGLWTNVPDLDAVRILMDGDMNGQARTRTMMSDFTGNFVAAPGHYLTVCSMNLAFRREVIPAFYQLPMDDNPWKIGRFDDIWSGVFLKRAADARGEQIVTGHPVCQHNKAPRSTFKDLSAEVPALELNEYLWQILEGSPVRGATYAELMTEMAAAVEGVDPKKHVNGDYLAYMARAMRRWVECCEKLGGARG